MPEFLEVVQTRRSIRRYKSHPISKAQILDILDLCRYAANAHNAQPYRFVVILNSTIKQDLINAMTSQYEKDLQKDGQKDSDIKKIITLSRDRLLKAPVLILVCLTMVDMDEYPDSERQNCEFIMGVQSVANSIQNLSLLAHSKGLGTCVYCAPLFCPDIVRSELNLPPSYLPQAFITMGVPDETPLPIKRKPIEELVQFLE